MCVHVSWKKRDHEKERKKDVKLVVKIKYIFNKWQWVIKKKHQLKSNVGFFKNKILQTEKVENESN